LFGDQQRNAKMAEYRGFGIDMHKASISKEVLVAKLKELLENDK
jgi:UDP:flavonoid glycosyltransferase YjiC (YdhE family)